MVALLIALFIGLINVLYFFVIVKGYPIEKGKDEDIIKIRGVRLSSEKFAAGVLIYFMGAISLITWAYFMYLGYSSFMARAWHLLPHVIMQLGASIYLLIAGHAVLRAWRRHTTIFFTSVGAVILVSLISMVTYGHEIHQMSMHVFSTLVQVVGSVFASAIFVVGMIFIEEDSRA
jgi:hypothetical protein